MEHTGKTLEFKFERTLCASPDEAFDAWLNPKIPGSPWNVADKLIWNPKVDGLYYMSMTHGCKTYGRFTKVERPGCVEHTWVSGHTLGEESTVTVTFKKKGDGTLMTLVHSGLPDTERAKEHEKGWNHFLDIFPGQFEKKLEQATR